MRYFFKNTEKFKTKTKPNSIWMNHLPYVSNCDGLGAHLDLHTLMSLNMPEITEQKCHKIPPSGQKRPIYFWAPFLPQKGNECDYKLTCYYDERFSGNVSAFKYWY